MNKEWLVTEVKASGISGWSGGAFTIAFVYSNKGNFIVKGYHKEVKDHLLGLISKGYRFFVNLSLRHTPGWQVKTGHRDIWKFWNELLPYESDARKLGFRLYERDYKKQKYGLTNYKWNITKGSDPKKVFSFKR